MVWCWEVWRWCTDGSVIPVGVAAGIRIHHSCSQTRPRETDSHVYTVCPCEIDSSVSTVVWVFTDELQCQSRGKWRILQEWAGGEILPTRSSVGFMALHVWPRRFPLTPTPVRCAVYSWIDTVNQGYTGRFEGVSTGNAHSPVPDWTT